ncbi:MAG: flagellar hook-length control protein FliK [Leptospiraceae bacterium]|nr:flagellar hook-length control protein FliK [Leptospiraceae bacterium]
MIQPTQKSPLLEIFTSNTNEEVKQEAKVKEQLIKTESSFFSALTSLFKTQSLGEKNHSEFTEVIQVEPLEQTRSSHIHLEEISEAQFSLHKEILDVEALTRITEEEKPIPTIFTQSLVFATIPMETKVEVQEKPIESNTRIEVTNSNLNQEIAKESELSTEKNDELSHDDTKSQENESKNKKIQNESEKLVFKEVPKKQDSKKIEDSPKQVEQIQGKKDEDSQLVKSSILKEEKQVLEKLISNDKKRSAANIITESKKEVSKEREQAKVSINLEEPKQELTLGTYIERKKKLEALKEKTKDSKLEDPKKVSKSKDVEETKLTSKSEILSVVAKSDQPIDAPKAKRIQTFLEPKEEKISINSTSSSEAQTQKNLDKDKDLFTFQNQVSAKLKNSEKLKDSETINSGNFKKNLEEIVKSARIMVSENRSSAEIVLNPKDLGRITLTLKMESDRMEGRLIVENEITKGLLLTDLGYLKEELKSLGIEIDSFSIDLNENPNSSYSKNFEETDSKSENSFSNLNEVTEQEINLTSSEYIPDSDRMVDIKV